MKKLIKKISFFCFYFLAIASVFAAPIASVFAINVPNSIFPLDKYDQNIDTWINPADKDYDQPLLQQSEQENFLKEYYNHYYATDEHALSPWSASYVAKQIKDI